MGADETTVRTLDSAPEGAIIALVTPMRGTPAGTAWEVGPYFSERLRWLLTPSEPHGPRYTVARSARIRTLTDAEWLAFCNDNRE